MLKLSFQPNHHYFSDGELSSSRTFLRLKKSEVGFTLVELMVVIAIMGIIASITLTAINNARDKAQDAKAEAAMSSVRNAAELYFDTNGDFDGVCADGELARLFSAASSSVGAAPVCAEDDVSFGAEIELIGTDYFCVDSTGFSGSVASSTIDDTSGSEDTTCD